MNSENLFKTLFRSVFFIGICWLAGFSLAAWSAQNNSIELGSPDGREMGPAHPDIPGFPAGPDHRSEAAKLMSVPLDKPKLRPTPTPVAFSLKTPLFLDVRPAFEFETAHIKFSQPIRWRDYVVISEDGVVQGLEKDLNGLCRRLATMGLHPDRVIYVVGKDLDGNGEEGRVAWMLEFLGVKDVRIRKFADVPEKKVTGEREGQVASPWDKAVQKANQRVSLDEAKEIFKSGSPAVQWIDVREKESFKAGHIQGAQFFDWAELAPFEKNQSDSSQVLKVVKKQKLSTDKRLVVYSDDAVRAALVAFLFRKAGIDAAVLDSSFEIIQSSLEVTR